MTAVSGLLVRIKQIPWKENEHYESRFLCINVKTFYMTQVQTFVLADNSTALSVDTASLG